MRFTKGKVDIKIIFKNLYICGPLVVNNSKINSISKFYQIFNDENFIELELGVIEHLSRLSTPVRYALCKYP